jgi:hypothetical protein
VASSRSCIFCGESPVTQEHLLGKWARRFADRDHRNVVQVLEQEGVLNTKERRWMARAYDRRAGVACQDCNNGWMSDLETKVSLLLDPPRLNGRTLSPEAQTLLATWAVKTALTLNAAEDPRRQIIASTMARQFGQERHPLENMRVWIASFVGDDDQMLGLATNGIDLDDQQDGERGWRDVAVVTFVIGPFVFQVLVGGVPEAMMITLGPSDRVQQLWPIEQSVSWRRGPGFTLDQVVAFAEQIPTALRNAPAMIRKATSEA